MEFIPLRVAGAFLIEPTKFEDDRGFFARTWCAREAEDRGMAVRVAQCSTSFNERRGTLRGMHYQLPPYEEAKLVRCTAGTIYDVILDLRTGSATFGQWFGVELSAANRLLLYVPEGFAHGFQTLADNTEVFYQMSEFYAPEYAQGVRWNDPAFGIQWPDHERTIIERDQQYADFRP